MRAILTSRCTRRAVAPTSTADVPRVFTRGRAGAPARGPSPARPAGSRHLRNPGGALGRGRRVLSGQDVPMTTSSDPTNGARPADPHPVDGRQDDLRATLPTSLRDALEAAGIAVTTDPDLLAGHCTDWTGRWSGPALGAVRPSTTEQVAVVLGGGAVGGRGRAGPGREHRPGRRVGARSAGTPAAHHGPGPDRSGGPARADGRGRRGGHGGPARRARPRCRASLRGRSRGAGLGHRRGDGRDERRRDGRLRLRHDARAGARAGRGPRRRPDRHARSAGPARTTAATTSRGCSPAARARSG